MKKIFLFFLITIVTAAIMPSCTPTVKVTSDYDKNANFQQYKTFTLANVDAEKQSISQLNQNRINNAVTGEMIKKGFQQVSSNADLVVNVATILKDKKSISSNTDYYGYGGVYRPYMWGGGMGMTGYTTYNVQDYKDGSLIIGVVDAKTNHLIWEGIGNSEIDKPLKDPDAEIPAAISKIMANFPPGAIKK